MKYFALGHRLPPPLAAPLFGDRRRHGLVIRPEDPCWREWERIMPGAYEATQRRSVGAWVNGAGYRVLSWLDLSGRSVLEIGPGGLAQAGFWNGPPRHYTIADVRPEMLDLAAARLQGRGVAFTRSLLPDRTSPALPYPSGSFDLLLTFYSLEHLYPLAGHLREFRRVLRPGGLLAGAIPCEGGLGGGLGRYATSRRWFKRHTTIDPDKLICWEHPNFADGIMQDLETSLRRLRVRFWPWGIPAIDLNLVLMFLFENVRPS